jgi:hypothetical protein
MSDEVKVPVDEKPLIKPEYTENVPEEKTSTHLLSLEGLIETISANPTGKARRLWEQMKIVSDGSFWVYDASAGEWVRVGATYVGAFNSAGTTQTPFPTGWSLNKTGTGTYEITHNLGTTSYTVTATPLGAYNIVQVASRNSNTFELYAVDRATGSLANTGMNFILALG